MFLTLSGVLPHIDSLTATLSVISARPNWAIILGVLIDWLLYFYLVALILRIGYDWLLVANPTWRPGGVVLVFCNIIFGLTDPPLRLLRRLIPPLDLGMIRLDVGVMVLFFLVILARQVSYWVLF